MKAAAAAAAAAGGAATCICQQEQLLVLGLDVNYLDHARIENAEFRL